MFVVFLSRRYHIIYEIYIFIYIHCKKHNHDRIRYTLLMTTNDFLMENGEMVKWRSLDRNIEALMVFKERAITVNQHRRMGIWPNKTRWMVIKSAFADWISFYIDRSFIASYFNAREISYSPKRGTGENLRLSDEIWSYQ